MPVRIQHITTDDLNPLKIIFALLSLPPSKIKLTTFFLGEELQLNGFFLCIAHALIVPSIFDPVVNCHITREKEIANALKRLHIVVVRNERG